MVSFDNSSAAIVSCISSGSDIRHKLYCLAAYNYVARPKLTGVRGHHGRSCFGELAFLDCCVSCSCVSTRGQGRAQLVVANQHAVQDQEHHLEDEKEARKEHLLHSRQDGHSCSSRLVLGCSAVCFRVVASLQIVQKNLTIIMQLHHRPRPPEQVAEHAHF